ncbi:acyl-CoA dehydrogenase [Kocuria tytonicola]|uniref:Acyl-CoA dehydrogenase n=1 Tax=Kocuria tytonicola TaxID=2055946 RepID=A0A3L9LY02_9MICC|nr:acyl-CoA dehydrogenase family protein [Kocuria tytonicola]RLY91589.1 acyl-CoA dehydrogenase [Kocuria tytonicola]RLZ03729.1 acyl-CoA dehydrogenase [Kocuria tytonicola]
MTESTVLTEAPRAQDTPEDRVERNAARAEAVARVAREHAESVDEEGRFPREAIDEARAQGLLAAPVSEADGGLGYSITELCRMLERVGRECTSTAMILAMHHSQTLCLTRHADTEYLREFTRRVATEGLLLASATTEVNIGGDTRTSTCAVRPIGDGRVHLHKTCPVISYGAYADAILVTARASEDAASSDQVLLVVEAAHLELERQRGWDALGMRGTCSESFELDATTRADAMFETLFETISAQTMLPGAHCLWASAWLGMATQAGLTARSVVQKAARKTPGTTPPSALRLAELEVQLQAMTDVVRSSVARYEAAYDDPAACESMQFAIAMNTLKVSGAEAVRRIVGDALVIVGITGFANRSPVSLARLYRDSIGPSLMVNNDRILQHTATMQLVSRGQR